MYTCKETIEKLTTADLRPLSRWEKLNVFLHNMMCKVCGTYEKQLALIKKAVKNSTITEAEAEKAVEKIKAKLESDTDFLK